MLDPLRHLLAVQQGRAADVVPSAEGRHVVRYSKVGERPRFLIYDATSGELLEERSAPTNATEVKDLFPFRNSPTPGECDAMLEHWSNGAISAVDGNE